MYVPIKAPQYSISHICLKNLQFLAKLNAKNRHMTPHLGSQALPNDGQSLGTPVTASHFLIGSRIGTFCEKYGVETETLKIFENTTLQ